MKLQELLQGVPIREMTADPSAEAGGVRYDSRAVQPGDLFVAVEGYQTDGHAFIADAVKRGAAAVLCAHRPTTDVPYILTEDTRRALALVSAAWFGRPAEKLVMIGVTGTNGKTTSAMLIRQILSDCLGTKVGLVGTIANYVGDREEPALRTTPESLDLQRLLHDMAENGCTHAVMEVSSHALYLSRTAGIRFRAGLFTNLTQDHLDFHGTMLRYAEAKALLFGQCDRAAINTDDTWSTFMAQKAKCPVLSFGTSGGEDLSASEIECTAEGVRFTARLGSQTQQIRLGIPGRFSVSNALTALAAGALLDLPLDAMAQSLARAKSVKGRMEIVPVPGDYSVVIDYAHTPDALEKALQTLREVSPGRVVAVFGCGGDRDAAKRPIMGRIAAELADRVIVTSDNPRTEDPGQIIRDILKGVPGGASAEVIVDRKEAVCRAIDSHLPGDVILLAGKGHETYQEINGQKHHMDEREIVFDHVYGEDRGRCCSD